MNVANDGVESTNLISVKFGQVSGSRNEEQEIIPNDVLHPASKNFPLEEETTTGASFDTIDALLGEFEDLTSDELEVSTEETSEIVIEPLSLSSSPVEMLDQLLKQTKALNEQTKKLRYYLDELNYDEFA